MALTESQTASRALIQRDAYSGTPPHIPYRESSKSIRDRPAGSTEPPAPGVRPEEHEKAVQSVINAIESPDTSKLRSSDTGSQTSWFSGLMNWFTDVYESVDIGVGGILPGGVTRTGAKIRKTEQTVQETEAYTDVLKKLKEAELAQAKQQQWYKEQLDLATTSWYEKLFWWTSSQEEDTLRDYDRHFALLQALGEKGAPGAEYTGALLNYLALRDTITGKEISTPGLVSGVPMSTGTEDKGFWGELGEGIGSSLKWVMIIGIGGLIAYMFLKR